jgi:hypothetical protein
MAYADARQRDGGEAGPGAGDYVVRHGWRGFLGSVLGLLIWTGIGVLGWKAHLAHLGTRALLVAVGVEAAFLIACGTKLLQALQREVVFAVGPDGIFFGAAGDQDAVTVPWGQICAVELFRERVRSGRGGSSHHCVGVRTPGSQQVRRPGSGAAAQPLPEPSAAYLLRSGRPDLIPGADGTIRLAYRRMSGWRVRRAGLAEAVRRCAPAVPVVDSPGWPPALSWADAHRAFPRGQG